MALRRVTLVAGSSLEPRQLSHTQIRGKRYAHLVRLVDEDARLLTSWAGPNVR
jgi:hypothetical protein